MASRRARQSRNRRMPEDDDEELQTISSHQETLYDDEDSDDETETLQSPSLPYTGPSEFANPSYCRAVALALQMPYKVPKFKLLEPYIKEVLKEGAVYKIYSVYLCTCEAPSSRTSIIRSAFRWIVSIVSDVHHVEFVFKQEGQEKEKIVACTVDFGNPVHFAELDPKGREYNTNFWDVYAIKLTDAQKFGIYLFCCWQENKPMNDTGLYLNFASGGLFAGTTPKTFQEESWFCSQLIAAALKWAGVNEMQNVEPRTTTPGQLKQLLRTTPTLFDKTDDHSLVPHDEYDV